jgi:site-specific DNA recombinase
MDKPAKKLLRCAVYTRKSTDHNLDLEFNSLDAQRESCEAYIKSQAHEGWRLIAEHYDDGAFSGASLDRPALQKLLAEIKAGNVDVIVVYKVDRLTRSLSDFAKLVELFDQYSASFVSVTQHFNTTSSMGRLTLNVLLSFAQFEREVIGERVRDKVAASKAKGIRVGGSIPLGYVSVNKKLVVSPQDAETVRAIFQRYLELGSVRDLAEDLDRKGVRTRRQTLSTGKTRGGIRFGVGALAHLLRNRFYIGEVVYRGAVHAGEHEPILDRSLFDAVQAKLTESGNARQLRLKASPSLLAGRLFDDRGNRMTPTHTNKQGARYRYYVSNAALQERTKGSGRVTRVSAHDAEIAVIKALRDHVDNSGKNDHSALALSDRELVEHLVERIVGSACAIQVYPVREPSSPKADPVINIPWIPAKTALAKGVIDPPLANRPTNASNRDALLLAIAKARAWIADLTEGRVNSFADIAKREGKVERHIRLLAPLAFVSPDTISDIIHGSSASIGVTELGKTVAYSWKRPWS